jgi:hypothetical protein
MKLKFYLFSVILAALLFAADGFAQKTFTATTSGKWSTMVWDQTGTPGPQDNVIIPDADTVTFDSKNIAINDLTVGGGASGVFQFSKVDTTSLVINGNLLVQAGASFKVQTNTLGGTGLLHTLELHGNLTHNGVLFDLRSGSAGSTLGACNLTLAGTTNSILAINTPYTTTNGDFNSVTINKTGGAKVILGSNIYMSQGSSSGPAILTSVLTFVNGIIETGSNMWVCLTSTAANVVGYSKTSYINGAMGRGMSNSGGSSKDFPVGDVDGYRLFNLRSTTTGVATGHFAWIRCVPGKASTGTKTYTNNIDKVSQVRYFQIGFSRVLGVATPNMGFDRFRPSYGSDDGVTAGSINLRAAYSLDSLVTWNGFNQTNVDTVSLLNPPTALHPDSLSPAILLNGDAGYMCVAISRLAGTTDNTLEKTGTGVNESALNPVGFNLSQNYPNPFNPSTIINFTISQRSMVSLKIFNLLGKEVTTLINSEKEPGTYNVNFNAGKLSNGVYFYKLSAGNNSSVKKMILMK